MQMLPNARLAAVAVALAAAASLAAQALVSLRLTGGVVPMLWALAGYFTVLTNTLVAATFGAMTLSGRGAAPGWLGGLTLWILVVGAVYHTILARLWSPEGLAWWADQGLHTAVPALAALWWIAFAPKSGLTRRHAAIWLAWPLGYTAYALIRGQFTGAYPYPFIDLNVLSPGQVAVNAAGLAAGFFAGGLAIVGLGRLLDR